MALFSVCMLDKEFNAVPLEHRECCDHSFQVHVDAAYRMGRSPQATMKLHFSMSMYIIGGFTTMYIQVTIDLRHYTHDVLDLRLSDLYSIKKMVEIVWQLKNISTPPREGCWVRVENKQAVFPGCATLQASGITNGDRIVIL
jgi:uncharacterized ubiquitin-like protein YukD